MPVITDFPGMCVKKTFTGQKRIATESVPGSKCSHTSISTLTCTANYFYFTCKYCSQTSKSPRLTNGLDHFQGFCHDWQRNALRVPFLIKNLELFLTISLCFNSNHLASKFNGAQQFFQLQGRKIIFSKVS